MSTCTKWVTNLVITCKNWSSKLDHECTHWADEGSHHCSDWADEGYSKCTSWEKCHWYTPWHCVGGLFCRAWYWVSKWACKAYYWVSKWVCKAFAFVAIWYCVSFAWLSQAVCVAWDTVRCASLNLTRWFLSLFHHGAGKPKIEHIFVLMLENRSFDHILGFSGLRGVDSRGNPVTIDGVDPAIHHNSDLTGVPQPVTPGAPYQLADVDVEPGHGFKSVLTQLCGPGAKYEPGGAYPQIDNSGFIADYYNQNAVEPTSIMQCYTRDQLPVIYKLAEEFAVCDQWFSSMPGPTFPNRFFAMAATSGGFDDNPDHGQIGLAGGFEGFRFQNGNIFDLLDQYCLPWRIYHGDVFPAAFLLSGMMLNRLQGRLTDYNDFEEEVNQTGFDNRFVFIEPKYGAEKFDIKGPGDYTCGDSMHPVDDVIPGEMLIKRVYEAIRNSPVWERSLLIITFDEHGGFYDHVAPKAAVPPGDLFTQEYIKHHFRFDRYGVRVPTLVISPLIRKGTIDKTEYDHTSILATVERLFGMHNLTERDKAANDLLHLLTLPSPRADAPTILPAPAVNPNPLDCEDDDDSVVKLRARLADLTVIARKEGDRQTRERTETTVDSTRFGFLQIALLRALEDAEHPDRLEWIECYRRIRSNLDAAIFMSEAILKIRHGIDVKRESRMKLDGAEKAKQVRA
jgi:phospholipase C